MVMTAVRRLSPAALVACTGLLALAGCGSGGSEPIPLARPEVAMPENAERLPLSMPPNYSLRPGQAERPRQTAAPAAALPPADGQQALLQAAGVESADPGIRSRLDAGPSEVLLPEDDLVRLMALPAGNRPTHDRAERLSVEKLEAR